MSESSVTSSSPASSEAFKATVREKWEHAFQRINGDQPGVSGLLNFTRAWDLAQNFLWPRDIRVHQERNFDPNALKDAFQLIARTKMLWILVECFVQDLRNQFTLIKNEIEQFGIRYQETEEDVEIIRSMVFRLAEWYNAWSPAPELGSLVTTTFTSEFQTQLFPLLPFFFPSAFKRLCEATIGVPKDEQLWTALEMLGILDRYESLVASVCYDQIEVQAREMCSGNWGEQTLPALRSWMNEKIVSWMILPFARSAKSEIEKANMIAGIRTRFDIHLCKTLCELRATEIFDIIVDYPESTPALIDLRDCLQRVDMRGELVSTVRRLNHRRLLHPGADTKDILTQYVSMIRCLRVVDPPGVLLHKVADPVRKYLRERPDTIRSIVSSLVGEGGDLVDENEPPQPLQMQVEDYSDANWEPDPIDASPDFRTNKPSDVISTLVSIYDSKDLFAKELQVLLAQRLLAITDGKFEKERRNIEILKVRFGEAPLQVCEVMLRDMTDSRRVDQHVQSQKPSVMHPTIISKHFWPPLEAAQIKMPGQFQQIMTDYAKEFAAFKPDKRLRYLPQLGTIDLSIELKDRTVDVTVPPLEAALIELFSGKDIWTVDDLAKELNVDTAAVWKGLGTWVDREVVCEAGSNSFALLEESDKVPDASTRPAIPRHEIIEEQGPTVSPAQQQEAEQMRVYWKFIQGMLTNFNALPLDRIQTMLKLAPNYSRTIEQLGAFMEAARREGLVSVNNGLWKLNPR